MIYLTGISLMMVTTLALHRSPLPPHALYAGALAIFFIIGLIIVLVAPFHPLLIWTFRTGLLESPDIDTAFATSAPTPLTQMLENFLRLLQNLALPGLVTLGVWALHRMRALYYPRALRWLFWPWLIGSYVGAGVITFLLQNDIWRFPDPIAPVRLASHFRSLGNIALMILAGIAIVSLLRRFGLGHPPKP